ncbi:hypothetical protein [Streptomyces sp. NEAU-W12]|uniref:hypothetical protein n=1 Tax=Streptomyces sp. NEAU-W12 TaxID=2994668 RepID=UPI00224B3C6B|nr:hypothetical protein [Streptomyces sp. NEAU-W12]MCX2927204.1 hypothetical protein [Streptomyces sp. NEAU-W12]
MAAREEQPGVSLGNVHGSTFAIGSNAHAESHHGVPAPRAADEELLTAVRELRADLSRLRQSEQTARLDEALAETEDEIDRTGAAGEGRRRRLRDLLADAETVTALLASAGTVAGLLGM